MNALPFLHEDTDPVWGGILCFRMLINGVTAELELVISDLLVDGADKALYDKIKEKEEK